MHHTLVGVYNSCTPRPVLYQSTEYFAENLRRSVLRTITDLAECEKERFGKASMVSSLLAESLW